MKITTVIHNFPRNVRAVEQRYESGLVEISFRSPRDDSGRGSRIIVSRQPTTRKTGGWCLYQPAMARPMVFARKADAMMAARCYVVGLEDGFHEGRYGLHDDAAAAPASVTQAYEGEAKHA